MAQPTGPKSPIAYYDTSRRCFWWKNARGIYIELNDNGFKRLLNGFGWSAKSRDGAISQLDRKILEYQQTSDVAWASPLAGYDAGLVEMQGSRILVTSSPKRITPVPGDFSTIDKLHRNLFINGDCNQLPYVYGWLKCALDAIYNGVHRPGQALIMAGPHNCGKSLVQRLWTYPMGGRSSKPYRYMSGGTPFNSDLFGSEHLVMEDEVAGRHLAQRLHFGSRIKDFTVNVVQSCHAKMKAAITLTPCWRLSISVNDEPENLMILPPVEESLADKIILTRAFKCPMPMPTQTAAQTRAFWDQLMFEMPAFVHYLLHEHTIPDTLRSDRFGITHYHHPELILALHELSPEDEVDKLLTQAVFYDDLPEWSGESEALRELLLCSESTYVKETARKLLNWPSALGTYLARLSRKYPDRFQYKRHEAKRLWTIFRKN